MNFRRVPYIYLTWSRMKRVICLQISTVFCTDGSITSKFLNLHGINDVRQTEIHIAELLVLKLSAF